MEFFGLVISQGSVKLRTHVLQALVEFYDKIIDKTQLQRFLGCLNYIRQIYKDWALDVQILHKRVRINLVPWNDEVTKVIQSIK
jgi:hypothetical protein